MADRIGLDVPRFAANDRIDCAVEKSTPYHAPTHEINNVELVHIPDAATGDYGVQVIASNVAVGPQPFALVVRGAL